MLETIKRNGLRLHRLTQNMLYKVDLEIIAADPQKAKSLFSESSASSIELIREVAFEKAAIFERTADLRLTFQLDEKPFPLITTLLVKITEELVDNAFRYSENNTPVDLKVVKNDAMFMLEVKNRGRGMTPEQIANIGPYVQFNRKNYEQQGAGLGLYLVRRIGEIVKGKLEIESYSYKDTTVRFKLPLPLKVSDRPKSTDFPGI